MLNSFCRLDHDGCSTPNPHRNQANGDGLVEVGPAGIQAGRQACMQQLLMSSHGILPAAAIPFLDQTERLVSSCSTPARDLRTRVLGFRSLESQGLGFIAPLAVRRMCCWRGEPFLLWRITCISGCRSRVCTFEDVGLLSTYVVCSMGGNTFMPRSIGSPFKDQNEYS
jgi:hypothetical protein